MSRRNLVTYRITLEITHDQDVFASPGEWEWGEILDPQCDPGTLYSLVSVTPAPLNAEHAEAISEYDIPIQSRSRCALPFAEGEASV